jgi:hypothetical protein
MQESPIQPSFNQGFIKTKHPSTSQQSNHRQDVHPQSQSNNNNTNHSNKTTTVQSHRLSDENLESNQ